MDLQSVMNNFDNDTEQIRQFIAVNFIDFGITMRITEITNDNKMSNNIELSSWDELTRDCVNIKDESDEISIAVKFRCQKVKISTNLCELLNVDMENIYIFDSVQKALIREQFTLAELKNYLREDKFMFICVSGIKNESNAIKSFNQLLSARECAEELFGDLFSSEEIIAKQFSETYYILIPYMESLIIRENYPGAVEICDGIMWKYIKAKAVYDLVEGFDEESIYSKLNLYSSYKLKMKLGICSVIDCKDGRFISKTINAGFRNEKISIFLRGIYLNNAKIVLYDRIVGVSVQEVFVNIHNSKIKSNVARDNLLPSDRIKIEEMLYTSIFNYIGLKYNDDKRIKETIENYSDNYSADNWIYF